VASDQIDALLLREEAARGIVFEIVEGDEAALAELLPRVRSAILKIRARFAQTEFAVVSHGREEFALQIQRRQEYADVHRQVQSLVAEDVPVHVCENHADWYGVTAQDFPDYVSVVPTGQGQIAVYRQLGYDLIVIDSSN
jgi:intracellular sulfur oxidation DsrE/DsrF family protein